MTETPQSMVGRALSIAPPAPLPDNEVGRLGALRRYSILDTPPEAAFDRITSLAARLFDVPTTLVSLVDESRAWFKSRHGFELQEVDRNATLCSFALLSDKVLVIPDTRQDDRLRCNPFVQSEPGLRFYAGAPLLTQDGFNLGTLCLLDSKPRNSLTDEQQAVLAGLAAMVVDELELRLAARKIAHIDAALLEVTQGIALATGEAFFSALVKHFTKALGVDYAYIGLLNEDSRTIQTIAACAKGQIIDNFAYLLQDTPCREVIRQRKLCCYPNGVQALFPDAPLLKPLGVESYVAIPFFDLAGTPLGLLSIMHRQPLENVPLIESLLTIFALRIVTELERQQTEQVRQQVQQDLEQLVATRTVELCRTNELLHAEIAERQQAETALQRKQELLKVLLDNVQAGIVACDAEGTLSLFNPVAREFHGLPEQPLPPEQWAEHYNLYLPDGTPMAKDEIPLFRALQGHSVHNVEMVIASPQATRTLLASGQAIVDAQGKKQGAVVVMHDITERKQAEAMRLSLAEERVQLLQAQTARREAETANRIKDEFLAVLSHELRTPLNPILGWSKLLRSGRLSPAKTDAALESIERNAKLQTQLIEDLLDISRILQGKLSLNMNPVNLKETIVAALETVQLATEAKSIQIHTQLDPAIGKILGDAARLQQVLWNLLSNAVKFTPEGGRVNIQLQKIGSQAQLQVIDTGKGIDSEFLPHVFEYFRQADGATTRRFGGLGLGLAIVRQMVELHGGTVQAASRGEGQGSTFTVRLPLLKPETARENAGTEAACLLPADALPLSALQILVVDDDVDTRELIAFVLEQAGAIVTAVASAIEALQVLTRTKPDILVSDIGMSNMDGYMLMRQARTILAEQGRQIPAIALTAYAGEINQQQALAAGFQKHLAKPVEPDLLIAVIVELVDRSKSQQTAAVGGSEP